MIIIYEPQDLIIASLVKSVLELTLADVDPQKLRADSYAETAYIMVEDGSARMLKARNEPFEPNRIFDIEFN